MRLDRKNQCLWLDRKKIELPYKTWRVAEALFEAAPATVNRSELIDRIWDGNYYVGEKALNQALWSIRSALGDDARTPAYIRTIPGQGYQWIGEKSADRTRSMYRYALIATIALAGLFIPAMDIDIQSRPVIRAEIAPVQIKAANGRQAELLPGKIIVKYPEGCRLNIFASDEQDFSTPVFSNNGQTLAFRINQADRCNLIVVDLKDKSHQKFESCPGGLGLPI